MTVRDRTRLIGRLPLSTVESLTRRIGYSVVLDNLLSNSPFLSLVSNFSLSIFADEWRYFPSHLLAVPLVPGKGALVCCHGQLSLTRNLVLPIVASRGRKWGKVGCADLIMAVSYTHLR